MLTALVALALATPATEPPPEARAEVEEEVEEEAPQFGLALDLTLGAGAASVQNAQYEQLRGNTVMPRFGLGARFHLAPAWLLGVQVDGAYNPAVSYDVAWGVVDKWGSPYAAGNAELVGGYHWRSDGVFGVLCEMGAGPSVAYSGGDTMQWGGHGSIFLAGEVRLGLLDLAFGPSIRAGWTGGPNVEALLLLRPSLAFGA